MVQQKSPQQEQGFTLVEVLVAILTASLFIAASAQAMVVATVFKVRARQTSEAITWIQEDLEMQRGRATSLASDLTKCNATAADSGYGKLLKDNLVAITGSNPKSIKGKSFTLTRTATVRNVAPFNVLQLTYSVADGANPAIATLDTEVIPDAALQCP